MSSKRAPATPDAAARRITDLLDYEWWHDVRIPQALFEATGGELHSLADAIAIIRPHWEGARALVGRDGQGYSTARELLQRLKERHEAWNRDRLRGQALAQDINEISSVLLLEAYGDLPSGEPEPDPRWFRDDRAQRGGGHGGGSIIADSLGWPEPGVERSRSGRHWRWDPIPASGRGPDQYQLVLYQKGHPAPHPVDSSLALFDVTYTWDEALRAVRSSPFSYSRFVTLEERLLAFRYDVLYDAVRTYEIAGAIPELDTYAPEGRWEPNEDDYAIACEAHQELKEHQGMWSYKSDLIKRLNDRYQDPNDDFSFSERRVKDALKLLGSYVNRDGEGKGKGGEKEADSDFDHLAKSLEGLYATHCKKE